jgi:hypothetical protein
MNLARQILRPLIQNFVNFSACRFTHQPSRHPPELLVEIDLNLNLNMNSVMWLGVSHAPKFAFLNSNHRFVNWQLASARPQRVHRLITGKSWLVAVSTFRPARHE